jgi:hypothetical protein
MYFFTRLGFVFLFTMACSGDMSAQPKFLEVRAPSGIALRKSKDLSSKVVSAVYHRYQYPIIDVQATFIQVRLLDGNIGWAYIGKKYERFTIQNGQATNIVDYAVPVKTKQGALVGTIEPKATVPVMDTWYGRAKLRTPNGDGWIYTGNLTEQNVVFLESQSAKTTFFADFSASQILSNMQINVKQSEFFEGAGVHRLYANDESEIKFQFDLDAGTRAQIVLEHQSKDSEDIRAHSPISIRVNDQLIVSEFQPASGGFARDQFFISALKSGKNTITLSLESGRTHYWIRSFRIYLDQS